MRKKSLPLEAKKNKKVISKNREVLSVYIVQQDLTKSVSWKKIAEKSEKLECWNIAEEAYKDKLSVYSDWSQKSHAENWLLFSHNLDFYLSIDETSLSNGELYTILTNKLEYFFLSKQILSA